MNIKWSNIKEIQKESNKIHNNQFTIINVYKKQIGITKISAAYIYLKCKNCGYKIHTSVNNHINRKTGCDHVIKTLIL